MFWPLKGQPFYSKGQFLLLPAPLDTINVHVREGHIIPQQVGVCFRGKKSKCLKILILFGDTIYRFDGKTDFKKGLLSYA